MEHTRTKVFNHIKRCVENKDGFPPFQDIADTVGISKSTAHYHVGMLKRNKVVLVDKVSGSYKLAPEHLKESEST
jgi:DNA-binding IclR family transcriptional regulator